MKGKNVESSTPGLDWSVEDWLERFSLHCLPFFAHVEAIAKSLRKKKSRGALGD